jgi:hypothetical protein
MILEVGRKYRLRHKYAENNAEGRIVVTLVYFNGGTLMFKSSNGKVYEDRPGNFCQLFAPYTKLKFIYKRRTSAFKPR